MNRIRAARFNPSFFRLTLIWAGILSAVSFIGLLVHSGLVAKAVQIPVVQLVAHQPQPLRPVYPYSVIPGGVRNSAELTSALRQDPVAAKHYQGFNADSATPIRMPVEKLAYVSYRVGDRIYWSTHQVRLASGERVLTDGSHLIRSRCGNRISFERPPGEASSAEPTETAMDLLAENFSDSTVISPWNEDGIIGPPSSLKEKPPGVPVAAPEGSIRSTPANGGSIAALGLPRSVVSLPLKAPPGDSPATSLTPPLIPPLILPLIPQLIQVTGGVVVNVPGVIAAGPLLPLYPIGPVAILPVIPALPGTGQNLLPLQVSPGTLISELPPLVGLPVAGILNSSGNSVLNPPLGEVTIQADQIDQAPSKNTPEPGTYLLTGGGLLLVTVIIRGGRSLSRLFRDRNMSDF